MKIEGSGTNTLFVSYYILCYYYGFAMWGLLRVNTVHVLLTDHKYSLFEALLMLYFLTRSFMSKWPIRPYFPRSTPNASSTISLVRSYSFRAAMNPHTDILLI